MKRFTASSSENFMHRPGLNITQYFLGASQQEWTTEQGIKGFHLPCAGQTLFPTRIKLGNLPASGFSCKKLPDVTQQMYSSKECYDPDKICDVPYMGVLQLVVKGEVAQPLLLLKIITFFFFPYFLRIRNYRIIMQSRFIFHRVCRPFFQKWHWWHCTGTSNVLVLDQVFHCI